VDTEPTWKTALIVDDDEVASAALARMLGERGFDATAATYAIALPIARTLWPGLIVIAGAHPAAQALARDLREHAPHAFVVAICGEPRAADAAIDAYMRPPVDGGELLAVIAAAPAQVAREPE
jgi:DNA-binding response OmpR family regulator